ncbi:hypothetical protein [Micromonospora sp. U21]|uniref:hypothetical protein n=1 Tax=Micromonospora sp. U21 TaxID=2824899 RepID=UPI001B3874D0|nr:hypothetical protein [Micromonospora sp. U21]MBQ0904121.1 hypothetical protein [Micromonospora sp. U21]
MQEASAVPPRPAGLTFIGGVLDTFAAAGVPQAEAVTALQSVIATSSAFADRYRR